VETVTGKRVSIRFGETARVAEVSGSDVRIESDEVRVTRSPQPGEYRVTIGERSRQVFVAGPPHRRWIFCDGRVLVVEVTPEGESRTRKSAVSDSLSAPMPATVVHIAVQPGQRVTRGETLVMLEAMKMELPIRAPHDAVVSRINCRQGELVQPGAPLLDLKDV
jgi:3-methylcrotonyl-CoA carboxylase alpha subunit